MPGIGLGWPECITDSYLHLVGNGKLSSNRPGRLRTRVVGVALSRFRAVPAREVVTVVAWERYLSRVNYICR